MHRPSSRFSDVSPVLKNLKNSSIQPGRFFVSPLVKFEATVALARLKSAAAKLNVKPSPELVKQAQMVVDAFVEDIGAEEVAITSLIGKRAISASALYGKAVGHTADLNFGDCFSYACAQELGVRLLYKGNDFAHTDLA